MKAILQITSILTAGIFLVPQIRAQLASNTPATGTISEHKFQGTIPGDVVYQDGDFDAPPAGQVMMADWRNLQKANSEIGILLATTPDDASGKQSFWYPQLQVWKTTFDQFVTSTTQADLFAMIPNMADFVGRNESDDPLWESLTTLGYQMRGLGYYEIRAMACRVTDQQGTVAQSVLANFVRIFAVPGFLAEGDWEDQPMPINAAGVMILDAAAVVTHLKAGPWQQAKQFLGGASTASDFFAHYTSTGDGLAVLKTKYSANQVVNDARFSELKTWADQQEQQVGTGN